jgi:hypothetical protein
MATRNSIILAVAQIRVFQRSGVSLAHLHSTATFAGSLCNGGSVGGRLAAAFEPSVVAQRLRIYRCKSPPRRPSTSCQSLATFCLYNFMLGYLEL